MWNKLKVVGTLCLVTAVEAGAQNANSASAESGGPSVNSAAVDRCQTAATTTVRRARPTADSVRFSPTPQVAQTSQFETDVLDVGEYKEKAASNWHVFAYNCQYNAQSSNANVSITWTATERDGRREGVDAQKKSRQAGAP
jgi:hypothetical protein